VPSDSKTRALIFLLVSLVLTTVIAAGLPLLKFQPGMPLPSLEQGQVVLPAANSLPVGMPMRSFAAILVLIILGVSGLVMVILALKGVRWRRLLPGMWSVLWKLLLTVGLILVVVTLLPRTPAAASGVPLPPPREIVTTPLGPVPPALFWVVGVILGAAILLLAARMLLARTRPASRPWEQEIERARQALLDGGDLREVIIGCYRRMGEALQEERGIARESSMTAGEFEQLLAEKGLPRDPVRQLTRLFETARYSPWRPAPGQEQEALQCLDSILDHCRRVQEADAR